MKVKEGLKKKKRQEKFCSENYPVERENWCIREMVAGVMLLNRTRGMR